MKEKKLLDALNEIEDEFINEAKPEMKKKGKIISFRWIVAAACFIVLVCVAVPLIQYLPSQLAPREEPTSSKEENITTKGEGIEATEESVTEIIFETEIQAETTAIDGVCDILEKDYWEKLDINQQYCYALFGKNTYDNTNTEISASHTGRKIADITAKGTDLYSKKTYTKDAEIFSVKSIDEDFAVAVKFKESSRYFVYINPVCNFETVGEIVEKLSLDKNLKVLDGLYREDDVSLTKYKSIDSSVVLDLLVNNKNLEELKEPAEILQSDVLFEISVPPVIPSAGNTVSVSKNGYLLVNIFYMQHIFFIGKEEANEFINSFLENHKGQKLVATTEQHIVYNGAKEDVFITEVYSNGYKP